MPLTRLGDFYWRKQRLLTRLEARRMELLRRREIERHNGIIKLAILIDNAQPRFRLSPQS